MERLKTYRILWFILRGLAAFCFPFPLSLGFTVLDRVGARPLSSRLDDSCKINPERQSLYNQIAKGGQRGLSSHLLPQVSAAINEIKQHLSYLEFHIHKTHDPLEQAKND